MFFIVKSQYLIHKYNNINIRPFIITINQSLGWQEYIFYGFNQ